MWLLLSKIFRFPFTKYVILSVDWRVKCICKPSCERLYYLNALRSLWILDFLQKDSERDLSVATSWIPSSYGSSNKQEMLRLHSRMFRVLRTYVYTTVVWKVRGKIENILFFECTIFIFQHFFWAIRSRLQRFPNRESMWNVEKVEILTSSILLSGLQSNEWTVLFW